MTQSTSPRGQTRHVTMAILIVATVAVLGFAAYSWHATFRRIAALETRLQGLADSMDRRLPAADWGEKLARATTRLEDRIDERMWWERQRLMAELDARMDDLAAAVASTSLSGERRSRSEGLGPVADDAAASQWAPDPVDDPGLEDEERFQEMFQSMRHSLDLGQERWAEVEWELEQVLESFWPEYVALSKFRSSDTTDLSRRYCARLERVLAPEEVSRLGCGKTGPVTDVVQPPEAGTTP